MINYIEDAEVKLLKDGVVGGENKRKDNVAWPVTDQITLYGGTEGNDKWGRTWTPDDINDPDFGFVLAARGSLLSNPGVYTASVDDMHITVFFHFGL